MDIIEAIKALKHFINGFSYDDIYFVFAKDSDKAKEAMKVIEERLFDDVWHKVEDTEAELEEERNNSVMCKWEDGCTEPFPASLIKSYNENPAEFGKIIEWKVYYEPEDV